MSEYYRNEIHRLQQEKSYLLTKLGQSIYYQYRIGQVYSEELKDFGEQINELDQYIHQLSIKLSGQDATQAWRCQCGNLIESDDVYCSKCGENTEKAEEESQTDCDTCGTSIVIHSNFCHVCGSRQSQG
ncbi:hypothetical protein E3U55_12530 [Filobacillus milosensis]|uniref:Uncharacterized protein n=1 Tax=Filobacillus milosensis TaxID=94137 RepID=A0A4Y8IF83_9BACI|nr:zinc ribbon domain-containing protein [Filobacillus milosensis]TFB15072.1 hypothetical protein E3U55_12530 [Filobacillus milosensis]